jgi:hypothetical protein
LSTETNRQGTPNWARLIQNPWFIGIASAIVATVIIWGVPVIGNFLLTSVGGVWHGVLDAAYRRAPNIELLSPMHTYDMVLLIFPVTMIWLVLGFARLFHTPYRYIVYTTSVVVAFTGLWYMITDIRSVEAKASYDRRMMVFTPFFSQEERKALIGDWGNIRSRSDYDALMMKMESLAKKYSISLPPRLDE